MAATIRPNEINMVTTPTLSNKTLPAPPSQQKAEKKITAPRIDLEPLYVAVKSAISDADWATYKSTISAFLLGQLNQEELSTQLDRILTTPALEHAHNQFIISIYANALREPPEPGTASWADDKVVSKVGGPGGKGSGSQGDEAEKRLKHEVMHMARRERKRLKTIHDDGWDPFYQEMLDMADAKKIHIPENVSASAGGHGNLNTELEIRKHYTTPLFVETHEFPDPNSIAARMLPICYENGLTGHDAECPPFMNIATETYIKEALSNFFQRVSSNGPGYIKTAEYKRKVAKEEEKVAGGELVRTAGGLLPIEQEELRKRRPLCMEDLRMAMVLGDGYLGQTPCIWGSITNGHFLDTPGVEEGENEERDRLRNGSLAVTAAANARMHRKSKVDTDYYGYNIDLGDPGVVMDDDWTWTGAGVQDLQALDAALDQCLAVGT